MKDRPILRSQTTQTSPEVNFSESFLQRLPHFYFYLGPSLFQTLYELLTAIYHGLVATNSPFSAATREGMSLVNKVAANLAFNMATAILSSVQHQVSTPPSWSRIEPCSTPVPDSISVCTHVTYGAFHHYF